MKTLVIVATLVACHSAAKPEGTGSSSTVGGSAAAESVAAPAAGPAAAVPAPAPAPPASTAASKPAEPPIAQPKRSAEDAARMSTAERSLADVIANAKNATTLKDACSALEALDKNIGALHQVKPPAGFEREFSEQRNAISMKLDVIQGQRCSDSSGADTDLIRDELESLRKEFVKLEQIGGKA